MINGHYHPYVQAAIEGEVSRIASAQIGERNNILFAASAALASLGLLEGEILRHFKPAAESVGLCKSELYSTVKSGVKTGRSNPRSIPTDPTKTTRIQRPNSNDLSGLPRRFGSDADGRTPTFVVGGDQGPAVSDDEQRRHVYKHYGKPIRVKIKRRGGAYVNWYRVASASGEVWQAQKPDGYVVCPYAGAFDAFDSEFRTERLYWPEGEKDCDTLSHQGLPAFTFGGTGDGLPPDIDAYLKGRDIVILADNDLGGQKHANKKAERAHSAGAANVRIVNFSELPTKGDVSDFLQTADVADLLRRVEQAEIWAPRTSAPQTGWRSAIISARDLKSKVFNPVRFALPGYIPEGVTIFAGKPKIGKSWFLYDVCVACASDRFVLGELKPSQGNVLYLALEDSQRRLKKRLEKLCPIGTWPERLTLASEWKKADEGGLRDLEEWCDSVQKPLLIVIDTLEKFRPSPKAGTPAYSVDYGAIAGLHALAHRKGIAIIVIHHVRKMEADDPFDMVSGTNGLTGAADTILVLRRQAGNVTLHARGRDIEERETACAFSKETCRWTLLGEAETVHGSGERAAITEALNVAETGQMQILEIMAATGRRDRNALAGC